MSSGPLPAGTLLIRARWGNQDSWACQWKPLLPRTGPQQLRLAKLGPTCHLTHTCMYTHTCAHIHWAPSSSALPNFVSGAGNKWDRGLGMVSASSGGAWIHGLALRAPFPGFSGPLAHGGWSGPRQGVAPSCRHDRAPTSAAWVCQPGEPANSASLNRAHPSCLLFISAPWFPGPGQQFLSTFSV